ncbi:MAG: hypothetical protein HY904_26500 [Deltaproteobacteria bacterium]|nr:hypothetical protein [Deltaproteobacteria bacterium]
MPFARRTAVEGLTVAGPGKTDKLSLRMGAVGLGQAGGNLAQEFHRRGYRALAVNTASTDLRALGGTDGLPEEARLYIGVEGSDGAGKDPDYGRACLEQHKERVVEEVRARMEGVDVVVLCAGLGGGTGSCVGDLQRMLEPAGLPLAALVTLPSASESAVVKVNAVKAAQDVVDARLNARLVVDNGRLAGMYPDADVLSYYPTANRAVLDPLDELNRLNSRADIRSIRSFDGEDFRKVFLSGGVVVPCVSQLDETSLSAKAMEAAVLGAVDGGHAFAPGMPLQKVSLLAVVLVAPEEVLKETRNKALDELEGNLKSKTGGGAVYMGVYATRTKETTLLVMSASQALPRTVEELLASARKEGQVLSTKIHEELPPLDVSSVAGMNLSRAPAPARLSRPPSASGPPSRAPRPVSSQVPPPRHEAGAFQEPIVTDATQDAALHAARASGPPRPAPRPAPAAGVSTQVLPAPEEGELGAPPQGDDPDQLQKFYEDLVERFRGAPDRKARERVARRLIEDSRSDDEDLRALSVWAMVALNERGFRRALLNATRDSSAEVRRLAQDGLQRLGAPEGGDE